MRITNQMILRSAMRDLKTNLEALAHAQREATTGRRVVTISDSPVDASRIMQIGAYLRDVEQYRRNGSGAEVHLSIEETVLSTTQDLIDRAKELAVGALSSAGDPDANAATLTELAQIRDQLVQMGNTKVGEEYIFGGGRTGSPPFQPDGTYTGDHGTRRIEINEGVFLETNHPGDPLLTEAIQGLDRLIGEIQEGTSETVGAAMGRLEESRIHLLAAEGEVGGRLKTIEDAATQLSRRSDQLMDQRESLRDADPTESVLKVISAQTALERAYSIIGRVLDQSLVNYLR